jgi:oligoribonuclease (3'-5' exoribonuclease)
VAPEFIACCHYRGIDEDVLNVLCRRWARNVYESRLETNAADLVTDLKGSIQLLQYYRANIFKSDLFVPQNVTAQHK